MPKTLTTKYKGLKPDPAVVKESKRIAEATKQALGSMVPALTKTREAQARFAATMLVTGKTIIITDDSVHAMAELIYWGSHP